MRVPLAGPHETPSPELPKSGEITPPRGTAVPLDEKASVAPPVTQRVTIPPPPPPQPPAILRFLPFLAGLFIFGIVIFLAIRFVPGFFGRSSSPVELTYWGLWEEGAVLNTLIADYQREHPNVKITYQKQDIKQYRETLTNRISGEDGPDMFRFHNTWVPMLRDLLAPIPPDIYSKEDFAKTFYPVARKDLQVGNTIVGIPLEIDTLALFINEADFAAAGLTPPATWNELRNAAAQLTVKDANNRIQKGGVALGTFDNVDHASDILGLMMMQNSVDFKKIATSISQRGDNLSTDTLAYYVSFAKGDGRVWDDTLDPSTPAFAKEKVSMYFGYSWRIFEIKALNPALKFRVVSFPQLPGPRKTFASYWVEGVSKNSRHQKEAFAFLKYLSQKETMQKLYSEQSKLRAFGEPYSRVDLADTLGGSIASVFVEQAKDASSWYLASNTYDNGVNDRMIKYFADAVRSVGLQNVSPKTAIETLAQGVEQVAAQYGL